MSLGRGPTPVRGPAPCLKQAVTVHHQVCINCIRDGSTYYTSCVRLSIAIALRQNAERFVHSAHTVYVSTLVPTLVKTEGWNSTCIQQLPLCLTSKQSLLVHCVVEILPGVAHQTLLLYAPRACCPCFVSSRSDQEVLPLLATSRCCHSSFIQGTARHHLCMWLLI